MVHVHQLHGSQQALPKGPIWVTANRSVIDSTAGSALLSFLDCYSGYHQIALKEED
jgi:hypothetical protein